MGQARDLLRVVADEDDDAADQDLELDQLLGERRRLRIEGGGGLVEQQHARLVGNGPHEPQPLALAGRQLGYRPVEQSGLQPDGGQQAVELGGGREMLARAGAPPGGLGRGIAHAAAPLRARHLATLHPLEIDVAVGGIEVGDGAQQPRLAGAGRALDGQAFVRRDLEGERRRARPPIDSRPSAPRPSMPEQDRFGLNQLPGNQREAEA